MIDDVDDADQLPDPIYLIEVAEGIWNEIRGALAGHGWFDDWDSINEAATVATRAILSKGPRIAPLPIELPVERCRSIDGFCRRLPWCRRRCRAGDDAL